MNGPFHSTVVGREDDEYIILLGDEDIMADEANQISYEEYEANMNRDGVFDEYEGTQQW